MAHRNTRGPGANRRPGVEETPGTGRYRTGMDIAGDLAIVFDNVDSDRARQRQPGDVSSKSGSSSSSGSSPTRRSGSFSTSAIGKTSSRASRSCRKASWVIRSSCLVSGEVSVAKATCNSGCAWRGQLLWRDRLYHAEKAYGQHHRQELGKRYRDPCTADQPGLAQLSATVSQGLYRDHVGAASALYGDTLASTRLALAIWAAPAAR